LSSGSGGEGLAAAAVPAASGRLPTGLVAPPPPAGSGPAAERLSPLPELELILFS